jgi:histidinol-phosphate aminotransferase
MLTKYDSGVHVCGGDNCLHLHRNENLFIDPNWINHAFNQLADSISPSFYPPDPDYCELREAIAKAYQVERKNVYVGNGADGVLADLFNVLRLEYDRLNILDISYKVYPILAKRFNFHLDILPSETFNTSAAPYQFSGKRLIVIDSPNAITGYRMDRDHLFSYASGSSFLIWDNVYGDFADDFFAPPIQSNVAFVRTFSKYFGLAGLRIGYCIADDSLIKRMLSIKDVFNVNCVAQEIALIALQNKGKFDHFAKLMKQARAILVEELRAFDLMVIEPAGNFVFATHRSEQDFAHRIHAMLEKEAIIVRRYEITGAPGNIKDGLRITVPPLPQVKRLTDALAKAF